MRIKKKHLLLTLAAAVLVPWIYGAPAAHAPVPLHTPIQDKNFYVLSLIQRSPEVATAVASAPVLKNLTEAKRAALLNAQQTCGGSPECAANALRFTDTEIQDAGRALNDLCRQNEAVRRAAAGPLRVSGMYQFYANKDDADLLTAAWINAAKGINYTIDVHTGLRAPRYPLIDSPPSKVLSDEFKGTITLILSILREDSNSALFFQLPLQFALRLLDFNGRDEAGRFEPLEQGENRSAIQHIASIRWQSYPYSVIVLPGAGSPVRRLRVAIAARRFREGKAPLLLVSGGVVRPLETPLSEAIDMKHQLMSEFGTPENAILIDPHARHTTTNLRNAARQIYRYGIPFDKEVLITSDTSQSSYIEGQVFHDRCLNELGYQPMKILRRLTEFDLAATPSLDSLEIDPLDPLDP